MYGYGDFSFFYDSLTDMSDYAQRCDYIYRLLKENGISDGIVLDLACGTGNFSEFLSEKGYDIIGTDASEDMLSQAIAKGSGRVQYLCQDMSETDLFGTINAAVCLLDSINHVTDPKLLQRAIERVGLFTEKGGIFIFDVNTPFKHRHILADNAFVYDTDEVYCVWQNELGDDDTVHIYLDFFVPTDDDGIYERYSEQFDEVIYSEEFLSYTLKNAGFSVKHIYDDLSHSPARPDSLRLIYVCEKIVETNSVFIPNET